MTFPTPIPETPVADLDKAIAYYVNVLGFGSDWRSEKDGIAGLRISGPSLRSALASTSS